MKRSIAPAVALVLALLAAAGVPSAMLFVRSLSDGVSHSPDELSAAADIELGVDVLAGAIARLAD